MLVHGPQDISQELIMDTVKNPIYFDERFSLVAIYSDKNKINTSERNKTLLDFGGYDCCGDFDYLMNDFLEKLGDNDGSRPLNFKTTTGSLIRTYLTDRSSSNEASEPSYKLPPDDILTAIFLNQGNISETDDGRRCLSMRGLIDSIIHYSYFMTQSKHDPILCTSLECSVVKNIVIFSEGSKQFFIHCKGCNQKCCEAPFKSLKDAICGAAIVGPLHSFPARMVQNERKKSLKALISTRLSF